MTTVIPMTEMNAGDWWENFEGRAFAQLRRTLADENEPTGDLMCPVMLVPADGLRYRCTRPPTHKGRHIARDTFSIAAAWPGALPPQDGDLL